MTARLGLHLNRRSSFLSILRSQEFTWTISQSILTSPTFRVVNPLNHRVKGDKVSITLPVSAVSGLQDEEILALLTKGYFGGWVFALEGWVMRACGGIVSANFERLTTRNIIWKNSDIPKKVLIPVGDMLFDFALVNKNIQTFSNLISSYVDYGFGSDKRTFAGSHHFAINRKELTKDQREAKKLDQLEQEEGYIEVHVESFVCNPVVNRDSLAVYLPWLHYWYARFLWAGAVRSVLRR